MKNVNSLDGAISHYIRNAAGLMVSHRCGEKKDREIRIYLRTDGTYDVYEDEKRTVYTASDMERNGWAEEVDMFEYAEQVEEAAKEITVWQVGFEDRYGLWKTFGDDEAASFRTREEAEAALAECLRYSTQNEDASPLEVREV